MNSTLATEPAAVTEEKQTPPSTLETWANNEQMRHVPPAGWMVSKIDTDVRKRIAKLTAVYANLASADPRHATIETELRALCKSIERLSDSAKPSRHNGAPADLPSRIEALLTQAVASLRSLEPTPFGRRNPFHAFDRSKAEPVYAALLAVICHAERVEQFVRTVDPGIDERLLEGLVVLQNPLDERMLRPIA
jgi:hypothetical protein